MYRLVKICEDLIPQIGHGDVEEPADSDRWAAWSFLRLWRSVWDGLLLFFCATTYAIATVEGFGWMLVAMGSAQTAPEHVRTRLLYVTTFALILFYREVPWADAVISPLLERFHAASP